MKNLIKNIALGIAFAGATTALADRSNAADLTVEVSNIRKADGNIMIAVYNKGDGFLSEEGMKVGMKLPANTSGVSHTFRGLDAGTYAVSVFHDVDADGELDSNFLGIPQEPFGMSRDAQGRFGPPKFKDAAFKLSAEGGNEKIYLN
jgi:uncharacterized protein (DUF2141 family)